MALDCEITCPLGSECEEIRGGKVYRCAWFVKIIGKNPQTGKDTDEWGCAMQWLPVLAIEIAKEGRHQAHAIEDLRNHVVTGNNNMASVMLPITKAMRGRINGSNGQAKEIEHDDSSHS